MSSTFIGSSGINNEAGGTVKLANNSVVCHGTIHNEGTLTLADNASVQDADLYNDTESGVIYNTGSNACFTMIGGTVKNNKLPGSCSGTIVVTNGAKIDFQGGVIGGEKSGNQADSEDAIDSSPGILLYKNSTGLMSGGTISNNFGFRGSAVMVYSEDYNSHTSFVMSGGVVSNNYSSDFGDDKKVLLWPCMLRATRDLNRVKTDL